MAAPHSEDLNIGVNKLVQHLLAESRHDPDVLMDVAVDKFINTVCSVAPELWQHICTLTQSVNEQKGHTAATAERSFAGRIKRVRRAYSGFFHPFHVLLADTIESCGGSTELITLLNRLGAVSSVDKLKRHIQTVSQVQKANLR